MKKIILIIIIVIGGFLRFYQLGEVPSSLDWDEASLGYNAYSLLLHGKDEYGNSWPFSIRSFNDYKPPAYAYLSIPSIAVFGLTEYAVRFPSALLGTLTVLSVYMLAKQFTKGTTLAYKEYIPLLSAAIFAISPWSLQFSRAAFEANVAVFFVVSGMAALLAYLNSLRTIYLFGSAILLAGAMYAYHAPRLIVPLLLGAVALRYRKKLSVQKKSVTIAVLIGIMCVMPLVVVLLRGGVTSRLSSVSIFKPSYEMLRVLDYAREDEEQGRWESIFHNRRVIYTVTIIQGYLDHFKPVELFMTGDAVGRHHAVGVGQFYLIELVFILVGIRSLLMNKFSFKFLFFFWALVAPIPAAISTGTPHAIRSILFMPIPQIAIAVGILTLIDVTKKAVATKNKWAPQVVTACLAIGYIVNCVYYFNQYYVHTDVEAAESWQYGYRELVRTLEPIENKYDKIIITTAYDQPYIYFLFYKKYDPRVWVNNGDFNKSFDKYEFRRIKFAEDRKLPNTLLVGSAGEIPEREPGTINVIEFPNGKLDAFRIYDDIKY